MAKKSKLKVIAPSQFQGSDKRKFLHEQISKAIDNDVVAYGLVVFKPEGQYVVSWECADRNPVDFCRSVSDHLFMGMARSCKQ
jgi:hypothetical protein